MHAIANAVITSKKECCFKNIVDKMMLTHNSKETNFVFFFFTETFTLCHGNMYTERVVNVNARKQVRRCVGRIKPCNCLCENVVMCKTFRSECMSVWINGGNNQKNGHSGS